MGSKKGDYFWVGRDLEKIGVKKRIYKPGLKTAFLTFSCGLGVKVIIMHICGKRVFFLIKSGFEVKKEWGF